MISIVFRHAAIAALTALAALQKFPDAESARWGKVVRENNFRAG